MERSQNTLLASHSLIVVQPAERLVFLSPRTEMKETDHRPENGAIAEYTPATPLLYA